MIKLLLALVAIDIGFNFSNHLKIKKIMGNTDQALADLAAIKTQLSKIGGETSTLLQKITDLENAANNADTPQSVLDAIADVKAQAQVVDDQVPDAPTGGEDTGTGTDTGTV